jgi:hypothetical protein
LLLLQEQGLAQAQEQVKVQQGLAQAQEQVKVQLVLLG